MAKVAKWLTIITQVIANIFYYSFTCTVIGLYPLATWYKVNENDSSCKEDIHRVFVLIVFVFVVVVHVVVEVEGRTRTRTSSSSQSMDIIVHPIKVNAVVSWKAPAALKADDFDPQESKEGEPCLSSNDDVYHLIDTSWRNICDNEDDELLVWCS